MSPKNKIIDFGTRKVQKHSNAMYLAIPCQVHKVWNLEQGSSLTLELLEEGLLVRKPEVKNED